MWDEVVNPLLSGNGTILNGNFVFDVHNFYSCIVYQEHDSSIKLDLLEYIFIRGCHLYIPQCTRYWNTRHKLPSSTLILHIHEH
jgi:hypothetical protein